MFDPLCADLGDMKETGKSVLKLYKCAVVLNIIYSSFYYITGLKLSQTLFTLCCLLFFFYFTAGKN